MAKIIETQSTETLAHLGFWASGLELLMFAVSIITLDLSFCPTIVKYTQRIA